MPYVSDKQRNYIRAFKPELVADFERHTAKNAKLPTYAKKKNSKRKAK